MNENLISVIDLAARLGRRKQTIFKVIRRLGIETQKLTNGASRGATLAYVTNEDAALVDEELSIASTEEGTEGDEQGEGYATAQRGVFYLLLLEPGHDPGRFKVGFATNLSERLRTLRCSAPFAREIKSWPCKFLWEKTAIDCVSDGCERIHTEVFRTNSIDNIVERCEMFFSLMPKL